MKIIINNQALEKNGEIELVLLRKSDIKNGVFEGSDLAFCKFSGEGVLLLAEAKRLFVGVKDFTPNSVRTGVAKGFKALKACSAKSVKMRGYVTECVKSFYAAAVEGALLGGYSFEKYKSGEKSGGIEEFIISPLQFLEGKISDENEAEKGVQLGLAVAKAANFARSIVNEIPAVFVPKSFEEEALKLAEQSGGAISCKVLDEAGLEKEGMNAFLAVAKASVNPPRLIHLIYKPRVCGEGCGCSHESHKTHEGCDENCGCGGANPFAKASNSNLTNFVANAPKIVFVGKGLTYDSGGLSLKPSDYMLTMKSDKSGAAAALGVVKAAAELKLPFEIHAVLGCAENMIGGNAYKPDDILISKSGKTIEVRNTDAEGRLVLCDCLTYVQEEVKPDLIIDFATLTGACVVGLGEFTSGVMGNNADLQGQFKKFGEKSGEFLTILEFNDYLKELIKSKVADISNTSSSRYGGAITAGLFLESFIQDEFKDKWLHIDIAGPAYLEKSWGEFECGATGAGVRSGLYFLLGVAQSFGF